MKIFRWKYLLPRFTSLLVLALGVYFGLDPLLKWMLISGGEAVVGAKVDVAELSTMVDYGVLEIDELEVANPRSPMRNLFAVDFARLWVDLTALSHKRVVIRNAEVSGLVFDTPRTTSGALPDVPEGNQEEPSSLKPWLEAAGKHGSQWLDQLADRLSANFVEELETPRVLAELEQTWPAEYSRLQAEIGRLQERGKAIQRKFKELKKNPLENAAQLTQLQTELAAAESQLFSLRQQIAELPQQLDRGWQSVADARRRDELLLRERLQFSELKGGKFTEVLLGENLSKTFATAVDWVRWTRSKMPSKETKLADSRSRGTTILFGPRLPEFVIEKMQLKTEISLGGETRQLAGMLTNATNAPHLWSQPTRLSLRSTGLMAIDVDVTFDRRGAEPIDSAHLACAELAMPGQKIGTPNRVAIELAPGLASLEADLIVTGEKISGRIRCGQRDVRMTARSDQECHAELATMFNQVLVGIDHFEADIVLDGTLDNPELQIDSELGSMIAAGFNSAISQWLTNRGEAVLTVVDQQIQTQFAELQKFREGAQQKLLAELGQHEQLLGQLASPSGTSRISVPQLSSVLDFSKSRK